MWNAYCWKTSCKIYAEGSSALLVNNAPVGHLINEEENVLIVVLCSRQYKAMGTNVLKSCPFYHFVNKKWYQMRIKEEQH